MSGETEKKGKTDLKFKACKHLDFETEYVAKKETVHTSEGVKACWNRPVIDETYPSLVQFCTLRGRLNSPTACLRAEDAQCGDYEDFQHTVDV